MDKITIKIEGAKEMENLLKRLGPTVARRAAGKSLVAGARPILAEAKRLVPILTGDLKRHLAIQVLRAAPTSSRRELVIGARKPESSIAHLQEFGTVNHGPQPFLRPALDYRRNVAVIELGRVLGDSIELEASKLGNKRR